MVTRNIITACFTESVLTYESQKISKKPQIPCYLKSVFLQNNYENSWPAQMSNVTVLKYAETHIDIKQT